MKKTHHHTIKKSSGFTLLEVILSLFIFSLIVSGVIASLRIGLLSSEQLRERDQNLQNYQVLRALLKDDLNQMVPRITRDEFGTPELSPFAGGDFANNRNFDSDERILLRFVRGAWRNPAYREPRSELQFVEYLYKGDQLIRRARFFLDEAPEPQSTGTRIERVIMKDVSSLEIKFLNEFVNGESQWVESWPYQCDFGSGH